MRERQYTLVPGDSCPCCTASEATKAFNRTIEQENAPKALNGE